MVIKKTNESSAFELIYSMQKFAEFFAYFVLSNGALYDSETRNATNYFLKVFGTYADKGKDFKKALYRNNPKETVDILFEQLRLLGSSKKTKWDLWRIRIGFWALSTSVTDHLKNKIGLQIDSSSSITSKEVSYQLDVMKWAGHIPKGVHDHKIEELIKKAEKRDTIVVVGDIRSSQDLMTYAKSPKDFSEG